jgi:hypothetical protein
VLDDLTRAATLTILRRLRSGRRSHFRTRLTAAFVKAGRGAELDALPQSISAGTPPDDATLGFAAEVLRRLPARIVVPR